MFSIMKEYVTKCNSEAHWCVFEVNVVEISNVMVILSPLAWNIKMHGGPTSAICLASNLTVIFKLALQFSDFL